MASQLRVDEIIASTGSSVAIGTAGGSVTLAGDFTVDTSKGLNVGTGATIFSPSSNVLTLGTNSAERVRISSSGELTHTAGQADAATFTSNQTSAVLNVKDQDGDGIYIAGSSAYGHRIYTNTTEDLLLGTNLTEKLRITSSGNVGIGTNSVTIGSYRALQVHSESTNSYLVLTNNSSGTNATNDGVSFVLTGSDVNILNRESGNILLSTAGGERARVTSGGNVNIANGNLVFSTSGTGIDFSATSDAGGMTSELLDDYEEGTWTARLRFGNTTEIGTYNSNSSAEYVKIGKIVHVSGFTRYDSVNTGNTGILTLDLPFAVDEHGMPHNWVYPGSAKLSHSDLLTKGFFALCGNAGAARSRFGFYNNTSGSIDYVENVDISGWNGNSTRDVYFNFSYQTNS